MASIFYIPTVNGWESRLCTLLEAALSHKKNEICRSFEDFSRRLHKPFSNVRVAVLVAANSEEITRILSLRELLADVKMIIILADKDNETLMKVHSLRPRYVTWMDCDLSELANVFKRMVGLYDVK